ncbi:hypothetical protein [Flammeovirga kamogawensis]|uniref:SPOR domain-containing protein n=1 Tax=Flammeovirga kamogawensis TaxID=373891 RepID=A0ABX8GRY2_9BACT|nr:hypothetical protein [Flammeovirga kamogawensis]MBB6461444.1 hypothetical protein [Flammeovirga kamogawensis]QWG06339.1 hypothetical protein KM029_13485 [Flammeovirga kamogawensis]TRX68167.1 hypothetical protein EO216_08500 [Flammeovirga kamogawensis]
MKLLIKYTLLVVLMSTFACKPSQTASTKTSVELIDSDLSAYMPKAEIKDDTATIPQDNAVSDDNDLPEGYVNSEVDSVLAHLSARDLGGVPVYRILVYSGRERSRAEDIVYNLRHQFGNYEVELTFEQPNYKVRAGYYFDRLTAHGVHTSIKKKYKSAFLIQEKMNVDEISRRIKRANDAKEAALGSLDEDK